MRSNRFLYLVLLLLEFSAAAQPSQKKLDSLQNTLFSASNTDTAQIAKTGGYIVKHTASNLQKFEVLEKISETYFRVNNINKSIAYSFKAKEVAEKTGDPQLMAQAYGSIANQYSYLNLTEKARPYLNKAIEQIEKLPVGDKRYRLKALSYLELGNLDFNNEDFASANRHYRQSLQQFSLIKDIGKKNRYHFQRSLYNIGNSYYYLKQPDSAESYLNRALAVTGIEGPNLKYYIYSTLAEVYTLRGNYRQAIDTLQTIIKDPKFDVSSLKAEIYLNLSRNYSKIGDKSNYTLYNEKHLALRDSVEGHERKAINTAFDVEQKDFTQSILESRQRNQWLLYCLLAIVAVSLFVIWYLNQKKKKEHAIYLSIIDKLQHQAAVDVADIPENGSEPETKANHSIPQNVEVEILDGLRQFEADQKFRNAKLTLSMLAVDLGTNPAYLSSVIKTHKDKNFNAYVNELRIGYICQKIHTHREYVNYKISYLADDCGFTSHSTFSTIFKKVTGISPSVFLSEEEKYHARNTAENA